MLQARTLKTRLETSPGVLTPVSPWGESKHFENDVATGTVFFAHRPLAGSDVPFNYSTLLESRNGEGGGAPPVIWELQIQLRFKVQPSTVFFSGQLWDGPMKLNLIARSLCKVILKLGSSLAQKRGFELLHSFGDRNGDRPMLALPLLGSDRMYVSDQPVALPVCFGGSDKGVWRVQDGEYTMVDRSSIQLDTSSYVTFTFATGRLDWTQWRAQGIPGLGYLDLTQFWGSQPLHVVLFDVGQNRERRYFLNFELESVYTNGVEENGRQRADSPLAKVSEEVVVEATIENVGVKDEGDEGEDEDKEESPLSRGDQDDVADEIEQERSKDYRRPALGDRVRIVETGRCGRIIIDDGSDLTYKVEFDDGATPLADWFAERQAVVDERVLESNVNNIERLPSAAQIEPTIFPAEETADNLDSLTFEIDVSSNSSSSDVCPFLDDVQVPWYFRNDAGALWWCIQTGENFRWRPHAHLQDLCMAVMQECHVAAVDASPDSLEYARRLAETALARARQLPGLLEEFLSKQVDLTALLAVSSTPHPWEPVGMVDAEGCVIERPMLLEKQLLWYHRKRGKIVAIDLCGSSVDTCKVAGTLCISLSTPTRQYLFVCRSEDVTQEWAAKMAQLAASSRLATAGTAISWADVPVRWGKERCVLNNVFLCLQSIDDAVSFSANLLSQALTAQLGGTISVEMLNKAASQLKCIDLNGLSSQDVWCFWLNTFHALLIHARIVCGLPRRLPQVISFFNQNSYIVAGHIFSLAEIEHCILRSRMSRPHLPLQRFIIRVWQRSDEYLQERPCIIAPRCPVDAFRCRPDWRLNCVISAGSFSSSDVLPIFQRCNQEEFDALLGRAVFHFVSTIGRVSPTLELPYTLCRYRDDAPASPTANTSEGRWAHALFPDRRQNATYSKKYDWKMRETLGTM